MDISPELLKLISEAYAQGKNESEVLAEIMAKVGAGTATYSEANDYAVELGRIMAEAFGQNLSSKVLPQGKMYWNIGDKVIRPIVTQGYEDVADVAEQVQEGLNEVAGIHIKAQRPQIDQRRIDRMIGDLMGLPDYDSGSQGFLNAVQNLLHSSVDDSIRTNAEFHYKAGLTPKIVRTLSGKCCKWCTEVAGSYTYPDVPRDVYKRHDNCRCKVDYKTVDGKTQSVHSGTEGRRKYVQVKNDLREHYELSKAERIRHAKEMEATEDARKEAARQKRIETWRNKKENWTKSYRRGIVKEKIVERDITIFRSVGGRAKNYDIIDKETGLIFHFVDGSKIQNVEVFAGGGVRTPLREEVVEGLVREYGGSPEKWQHAKGIGVIDCDGEEIKAEVHWFQEESVGKVKFKVKRWLYDD